MNTEELLARYGAGERDFTGADLREVNLTRQDLSGACFADADLRGARCYLARFVGSDLSRANMTGARMTNVDLSGAVLEDAICRNAMFGIARSRNYSKSGRLANFRRADFTGTRLLTADFDGVDLTGAVFSKANMAKMRLWASDLTNADLRGARMREAHIDGCCLAFANLTGIKADYLRFARCDLTRTVLHRARMKRANIGEMLYQETDFSEADLSRADMTLETAHTLDPEYHAALRKRWRKLDRSVFPVPELTDMPAWCVSFENADLSSALIGDHQADDDLVLLHGAKTDRTYFLMIETDEEYERLEARLAPRDQQAQAETALSP